MWTPLVDSFTTNGPTIGQAEVLEPLLLLASSLLRHPGPPLLQLVVPELLGVVPGDNMLTGSSGVAESALMLF